MPAPRRIFKLCLLVLVCLLCLPAGHRALAQTPSKPLSKTEVVNLLQAAVPSDQLREIVRKRGTDFQVTA